MAFGNIGGVGERFAIEGRRPYFHAAFSHQADREAAAIGREGEFADRWPERPQAAYQLARGTVEDVDVVGGGQRIPAAGGYQAAIGRNRNRMDLAAIVGRDWHPQRSQQLSVGQRPQAHRLVARAGHHQLAVGAEIDPHDDARVHAGLDPQHWALNRRIIGSQSGAELHEEAEYRQKCR